MREVVAGVVDVVSRRSVGSPLGLYLTGSACHGGWRPDSDVDLVLLTRRPLDEAERRLLVEHLLRHSGRRATVAPGRPVELLSLVGDDVRPWRYPATRDFGYGEWLRDDYEAGHLPVRETDVNLPVVVASARERSHALIGPPFAAVTDPVPNADVARAVRDAVPGLIAGLPGDERNVLLTLARVLVTLRTGEIVPKDVAAAEALPLLGPDDAALLDHAARAYRGEVEDEWAHTGDAAARTAGVLRGLIDGCRQHRR